MHSYKTAVRSLFRNKVFSAINICGLALGMAVFLLIMQFVASEWSANRFHQNYGEIYRLATEEKGNYNYYLPPGYGPIIKDRFPTAKSVLRIADGIGGGVISEQVNQGDARTFREEWMIYVEGSFLETFSFPLVSGTPSLKQPKTLALSASTARKLMGTTDAVGKTVLLSNQFGTTPYTVQAVFKDIPENSDIKANVLMSIHTLESPANRDGNDWADPNTLENGFVNIFLLVNKGTDEHALAKQLTTFARSSSPDQDETQVILQPLKHLHLAPGFNYPLQTYGSLGLVTMLLSIALLILIIAWVNYINLSTVQALKRAREAGVRKVLGASKAHVAAQFLRETFVVTIISFLLALLLTQLLQPLFNSFTGKSLSLASLSQGWFWLGVAALILAGTLLAGGYVAFVLSSFKPINILKGQSQGIVRGNLFRKGMVVFQFAVSIIFIVATIVLFRQLNFMKSGSLGFSTEQLLVISGPTVSSDDQAARNKTFKNQLAALPFVEKVAGSNNIPGRGYNFSTTGITRQSPSPGDEKKPYNMFIHDQHFFSVYSIPVIAGRTFTEQEADASWNNAPKVILNQKAAKELGFSPAESAVGRKIVWGKEYEVVGVVKDYHHLSMHKAIEPVIYLPSVSFSYFTVKTGSDNMPAKLAQIQQLYKTDFPGNPWEYFFADEAYNDQYKREQDLGKIFIAAALVAIFIACLGLFGLAAFTAQQRVREIGIRKVLGASVLDITQMLSTDFIRLVCIAILLAVPIAWWGMHRWLQDFAYRTEISWWFFAVAGLGAIAIAIMTISVQAVRAAMANPVHSLRSE